MENCIEFKGLRKRFGRKRVLRGVDLQVKRGQTTALLGGSGDGKSVLIKHVIGLLKADAGQVIVCNEDITDYDDKQLLPIRKKVSMLFQSGALFDSLNVFDNVSYPLREHTTKNKAEISGIVAEKLSLVGLANIEQLFPAELSGGMRKRVSLARALVLDPEIILYDEPTTGLDPIIRRKIIDLIADLHQKLATTSIIVTHDVDLAFTVADNVFFLNEGKIEIHGSPEELKKTDNVALTSFLNDYFSGHAG